MEIEVCVDSVESAIAAERGGAQRVELCSDLLEGGITPGAGLIASVRRRIAIGLYVMIRPRGGDFCYTDLEFEVMRRRSPMRASLERTALPRTVGPARPRRCSAHAASGRSCTALAHHLSPRHRHDAGSARGDGRCDRNGCMPHPHFRRRSQRHPRRHELAGMVRAAKGRIAIMPGGGITPTTITAIAQATGATEFHASARTAFPSPVSFRKQGMAMGDLRNREYRRFTVREKSVRALVTCS